ncbi:hypothetical protein D3C76_163620 [compost metagenome]
MAFEGQVADLWTAIPGIIESVDLVAQTVSVQPAIRGTVQDEKGLVALQNMPLCDDVPICWPRAGGFAVTLPVKKGDECLLVFSARCIDAWWQSGGVQAPLESRMHDLSDAFAIFAPTSQPKKLADVQSDGIEIRTDSRSTYLKLSEGAITIKGNIVHEGNYTQTGDYTQTGNYSLTGNYTHTGGTMYSLTKKIDGAHTHGGVTAGGANTAVPNP